MMIESPLRLDVQRGTSSFVAAHRHCGIHNGFNREDVERVLVWHCLRTDLFVKAHVMLRDLGCRCGDGEHFRVRMVSKRLVLISCYSEPMDGESSRNNAMLVELGKSGEVLDCEVFNILGDGPLSFQYPGEFRLGHEMPETWLDDLLAQWRHNSVPSRT